MVVVCREPPAPPAAPAAPAPHDRLVLRYVMPPAHLTLREEDVVRLTLEFLQNRQLHISQLSVERETGVINGEYSEDVVFLRQLVLDGQWDDVLEFIQPLEALPSFDMRRFKYAVLRHKYVELLCIKNEAGLSGPLVGPQGAALDTAVDEVVKVMKELERYAPSKDEYSQLCLLLTLPRLSDHLQYRDWNPSNARVQCFQEVFPLVEKFLPGEKKPPDVTQPSKCARNDRLVQLLIKGVLYESCVAYCQGKATGSQEPRSQEMQFGRLLDGSAGFSDSDLSLLSWLQSIPPDTFAVPFEQRTLSVDVERLERPSLETSWTEHMLVTPIKPKMFPHSAMPLSRPRSAADMMTRSLLPGLPLGAGHGLGRVSSALMTLSTGDIGHGLGLAARDAMSRSSFASFHLTGHKNNKLMNTSVDRLFETDSDVFLSSSYAEYPLLPAIQEMQNLNATSTPIINNNNNTVKPGGKQDAKSQSGTATSSALSTPEHRGRESPAHSRSSRSDSLTDKPAVLPSLPPPNGPAPPPPGPPGAAHPALRPGPSASPGAASETSYDGGNNLLQEYQRQKMRYQQEAVRDNRLAEERAISARGRSTAASSSTSGISMNGDSILSQPSTIACDQDQSHYDTVKPVGSGAGGAGGVGGASPGTPGRPKFVAVTALEDVQAVRCAEFHPHGKVYAVGSNSKTLRICAYPKLSDLREDHVTYQPTVLFKRTRHHKGSIYCMAWSPVGDLMATGSNDKTVKLMRFNADTSNLEGQEIELSMHDGTVRDVCFLEDTSNKSSLLISGGAGDCKIYVTDCATGQPYQALSGHSGHILSLYNWGGAMFVSGSQDRTVRFWDLRTRGCVDMVSPQTQPGTRVGSPVAAVCMDPSGRLLVSGHEDASCVLYDVRGGRTVQCFKPHASDIRSIRFSPSAYYLLTAGYDNKLVLTDLQGDLTMPLPSVVVAQHTDKVISGRWHPTEFSFLSTSADKTATLWALPPV